MSPLQHTYIRHWWKPESLWTESGTEINVDVFTWPFDPSKPTSILHIFPFNWKSFNYAFILLLTTAAATTTTTTICKQKMKEIGCEWKSFASFSFFFCVLFTFALTFASLTHARTHARLVSEWVTRYAHENKPRPFYPPLYFLLDGLWDWDVVVAAFSGP